MTTRSYRHVVRRWLERGLTALVVVLLIGLIPLWLTFQHKPAWYRPPVLDAAGLQSARADAVAVADDIGDRLVRRESFDLVLTDSQVNEWLAALPHAWPDALEKLPPGVSDAVVSFEAGHIRIGAHCVHKGWRVILSAVVVLGLSPDGQYIDWRLVEVNGGSLRVPKQVLARFLDPAVASAADRGDDMLGTALGNASSLDALFGGTSSLNGFTWFNGRRRFRLADLRIKPGALHLRIEPL